MPYTNNWKRAHGASVVITPVAPGVAQTFSDATVIGIPGTEAKLIEKTSLGASRKEWDVADRIDGAEIEIRTAWTGAVSLAGSSGATVAITLPTSTNPSSFTAHVISDLPQPAEVGGLLIRVITLKPLS